MNSHFQQIIINIIENIKTTLMYDKNELLVHNIKDRLNSYLTKYENDLNNNLDKLCTYLHDYINVKKRNNFNRVIK